MYEYTTKCQLAAKLELELLDHMAPECKLEYLNVDNVDGSGMYAFICSNCTFQTTNTVATLY